MQWLWALMAALALWLAGCTAAHAGALSVMPTRVDFAAGNALQSLLITNTSDTTLTVEAQVVVWPDDAANQLANDIVVTPAVVTLPPNQRVRVRVGVLRRPGAETEHAYRIYFTELAAPTAGTSGVGVRLRVGIPVFVAPEQTKPQALQWTAHEAAGSAWLQVANPGNVHARLTQATLVPDGVSQPQQLQLPNPYVLAGAALKIPIGRRPPAGARVRWQEGNDEHDGAVAQP